MHLALSSNITLYLGLGGLFVGFALILLVGMSGVRRGVTRARVQRRISIYTLTGRHLREERRETTALGDSAVARSAVGLAGRVIARQDLESLLTRKLEAAGLPLKAPEWLLLHVGIAVGLPFVLLILTGNGVLITVIGLFVGLLGPLAYLTFRESRRVRAFLAQLPNTLQLMAGSLSAGYSLLQSVDAAVRDGTQPVAGEFSKALVESRLGVPVDDALESVAVRMKSKDFSWTVMAIRIQREVGGNLAEILNTVSQTLRERERLRRQVRSLSAEGRLSAWILGSLPVLFTLYLLLVRPSYIRILYTNSLGIVLIVFASIAFVFAVLVMRKMVRMEV